MKLLKILFALSLFISFKSYSQTKQDYIKELFVVMKQDSLMEQMGKNMVQGMLMQQQMVKKANPEMINKSTEKLDQLMNVNDMVEKQMIMMKRFVKEDLAAIYDKHFSVEEIKDYIQFYKSVSGQKFQKESPKLQNDIMMVMMQKYMPEIKRDFDVKFDKIIEEKKKEQNKIMEGKN